MSAYKLGLGVGVPTAYLMTGLLFGCAGMGDVNERCLAVAHPI